MAKLDQFKESLEEIKAMFIGRQRLYKAYTFLTEQYLKNYLLRIKN